MRRILHPVRAQRDGMLMVLLYIILALLLMLAGARSLAALPLFG